MEKQLIIYPEFDSRIERDYMYSVSVTQGMRTEVLPVYNHTEDSWVSRNPVDGRRIDEYRRFSAFAFSGEGVRVDIRVNCDFSDYTVMPSRKHFQHSYRDGVISVYLDHPDYFAIRLDGYDHTILTILADEPETEIPVADENTIVVDRWQEYKDGILCLTQPHTTVYIPAGAVLNARIQVLADDCRIIGRGAIVDPAGDIYRYNAAELDAVSGVLQIRGVDRTLVDGILFLDSKAFNVAVIGIWNGRWANDNVIRNIKILSTQMSSDGITFCYNARNSRAEHCFVYCGDNALVYEDYAYYRDITIGTTCNALYPQTDVRDSMVEDVYVFRADEGLINPAMGGSGCITRIENHTVRNFSAVDITFTPYFLFVEIPTSSPVVSSGDGLVLENIWLRALPDTKTCSFYQTIAGGDYKVTMKNVSVNGKLMETISADSLGAIVDPAGQTFCYMTGGTFDPAIVQVREKVDYRKRMNVFVGHWQIFFRNPILFEGNDVMLPAESMQAELRTEHVSNPVLRNGVKYIRAADLKGSGMAKAVSLSGNRLIVTPNENFGNLLLPDSGIVSKFTERVCYAVQLVTLRENGELFYRVINKLGAVNGGIFRSVAEEVCKYGAGIYRLTFDARSDEKKTIRALLDFSNGTAAEKCYDLHPVWTSYSIDAMITESDLDETKIAISISGCGSHAVDVLDVKNICFKKLE